MNEKHLCTIKKIIDDKRYYKILEQKEELYIFSKYIKSLYRIALISLILLITIMITNIAINVTASVSLMLISVSLILISFISTFLFGITVTIYLVKSKFIVQHKSKLLKSYIKDNQELIDVADTGLELLTKIKDKGKHHTYEEYQAIMFADFMSI